MYDGNLFISNDLSNSLYKISAKMSTLPMIIFVCISEAYDDLETARLLEISVLISNLGIDLNENWLLKFSFLKEAILVRFLYSSTILKISFLMWSVLIDESIYHGILKFEITLVKKLLNVSAILSARSTILNQSCWI